MINITYIIRTLVYSKRNIHNIFCQIKRWAITFFNPQDLLRQTNFRLKTQLVNLYVLRAPILSLVFLSISLYHLFYLNLSNQNVLILLYLTFGGTFYLFLSGFVYFIKLYAYNRFTGFIQDF